MSRGITVWEECEHGHVDRHWNNPRSRKPTLCPGGRSVSLTREDALELMEAPGYHASLEELVDALLAVVDKETL